MKFDERKILLKDGREVVFEILLKYGIISIITEKWSCRFEQIQAWGGNNAGNK